VRRLLLWLLVIGAVLAVALFVLDRTYVLVWLSPDQESSNAPAIPSCNGRVVVEGITYHLRDPRRGEMVGIHAAGSTEGAITPDAHARQLVIVRRVVGIPGDQVTSRKGSVYVNGFKADSVQTGPFKPVQLGGDEYFVLGDNRSVSEDSRTFGPVPRDAIFGRAFLVYWPLGDFGGVPARGTGAPPGQIAC
jgi:signal peptidase I